ncbi:polyadenylate-binding protein 2-B-like [Oscarella lobularis]|uniref:polyadenylate-binding protein 2-B-like n=1 Tax=Oscarella lobularis TaxID=121494 RepID=UPI0033130F7E
MADDASTDNILAVDESVEGEEAVEGDDLHEDAETDANGTAEDTTIEDPELEAIKQRVKEMEEEAEKLKEMQSQVEKQIMSPSAGTPSGGAAHPSLEEKQDADARSVYVGNVDYGATAEELESHFHGCGAVNRVTILCDKFTGHPKGFAYIEFAEKDAVTAAVALDDSLFRGRQIKVSSKRTNRPGISSTNRSGGRMRGRRPHRHFYQPYYQPRFRGRYRRRASSWHAY